MSALLTLAEVKADSVRKRAHRIPRLQNNRLLRSERGEVAEVFLFNRRLEDVLVKPAVRADVVSLVAALVAPAVFNFPAGRLARCVEVDAGQHHGVVHGCQTVIKRVGFVHRKIHAGQQGEVEAPVIPDARGALAEMPDVAAEPNDLARFELSNDGGFEFAHRQVEVNDGTTFRNIAQQTDGVGLVIGLVGGGSVDDADNLLKQVADITLGKGQRSEVLLRCDKLYPYRRIQS